MTEALLRDQVELKRQQSREADLNRFGSIEKEVAVLGVHFKALIERFEEALERAVSGEDLKELKREMEAEVQGSFTAANEQQSRDILGKVETMFASIRNEQKDEQLAATKALLGAISERRSKTVWWVLGIVGSIIISVASTLIVVALIGRA